jgi:hypothetical protein
VLGAWVSHRAPAGAAQQATAVPSAAIDPAEAERCRVPDFAKAIGHETQWKLHNNCPP